jgi:hypothetical protein
VYKIDADRLNSLSINGKSNITMLGGYPSEVSGVAVNPGDYARNPAAYHTILDGDINGDDVDTDVMADPCAHLKAAAAGMSMSDNTNMIIYITSSTNITIDGFDITNGCQTTTAYPSCRSGGLCLEGFYSGGIPFESLVIKNCRFYDNCNAQRSGGAVGVDGKGTVTIENCDFWNNSSNTDAGAVVCSTVHAGGSQPDNRGVDMYISDCTFDGNVTVNNMAGAVFVWRYCNADITDCVFTRNYVGEGGARAGTLGQNNWSNPGDPYHVNVTNCVLRDGCLDVEIPIGNKNGGGMYCGWGEEAADIFAVTFTNCLVSGNVGGRAAIWARIDNADTDYAINVNNCTVVDNNCSNGNGCGGIDAWLGATINVKNSIVWGNTGSQVGNVGLQGAGETATDITETYCCIQTGDPNTVYQDNGTNTTAAPTFADADYHLATGSVGIDAGDPADDWSKEPKCNGERINMGAYGGTVNATPTIAAPPMALYGDVNCDGAQDLADFSVLAGEWLQTP